MRLATGVLLVALTACGGGSGGGAASPAPTTPPPTSVSASPTGPPAIGAVAKRLRAATAATLAQCPCGVFLRVTDGQTGQKVELYGGYDPKTGSAKLGDAKDTVFVGLVGGATYYRGPLTRDAWVRLDTSALPSKATTVSPVSLAAMADPSFVFTMLRGASFATDDGKDEGRQEYSVTYDLAAARPGAFLRRLVGTPTPYGAVYLKGGKLDGAGIHVLGPGSTTAHRITIFLSIMDPHVVMSPFTAPPHAAVRKVP